MSNIHGAYGRDLDLNLLRVFVAVASRGSVTQAAAHLYLTQPAVSAALRRLTSAVGTPLFVRSGRGLRLSRRGEHLFASAAPLLDALLKAALAPSAFDAQTNSSVLRIGLSDAMEGWLLPPLLRALDRAAPRVRLVTVPVQFRSLPAALATRAIDLAVTVADELPASVQREGLLRTGFVCLFDPKRVPVKKRISERDYFAREHVIVSYNADLRGIVEDLTQRKRRVRCAVASFSHVGAVVSGSALLATVPTIIARHIQTLHPTLHTAQLPFALEGGQIELLWPLATDDDDAGRLVREQIRSIARTWIASRIAEQPRPTHSI